MLGDFFSANRTRRILQQVNLMNMVFLTYNMINNQDESYSEDGFAFLMSLVNVCCLSDGSDLLLTAGFISSAHLGAVFTNVTNAGKYNAAVYGFQAGLNLTNIIVNGFKKDSEDKDAVAKLNK